MRDVDSPKNCSLHSVIFQRLNRHSGEYRERLFKYHGRYKQSGCPGDVIGEYSLWREDVFDFFVATPPRYE